MFKVNTQGFARKLHQDATYENNFLFPPRIAHKNVEKTSWVTKPRTLCNPIYLAALPMYLIFSGLIFPCYGQHTTDVRVSSQGQKNGKLTSGMGGSNNGFSLVSKKTYQ